MAVDIQVIRFQKTTAGSNGQTQDVAVNFTPKAILLFSEGSTSNNTLTDNYQRINGFSDGTNHACVAVASQDGVGTSNTGRIHRNDSVFIRLSSSTPTTVVCRGSCIFQTNNIRFTWDVQDANAYYIGLIVIGGADITNTKVNTVDIGTTGTGNRDYTGLGFTPTSPNGVLFTLTGDTQTINTALDGSSITFGAGISSSKRLVYGDSSEDAQGSMDTWRYVGDTKTLANLDATSGAIDYEADFVDWITDGFRLNITNAASATTEKFSYLAIKGGTWDCGKDGGNATTGTKNHSVSVSSNTLRGLLTFSMEAAVASWNVVVSSARSGFGMSDGTNEFCLTHTDEDANTDARCISRNSFTNRVYNVVLGSSSPGLSTNFQEADFSSFGTNQFTLNHTVVQSNNDLRIFGWLVVADAASAQLFQRSVSDTISISSTLTPKHKYALTQSVTIVDALARKFKDTLADTLSTSSTLTPKHKLPLTQTVSISDIITSSRDFFKALADTLSNSDAITRKMKLSLSSSVTVSDIITTSSDFFRALADTLSISSTLTPKHKLALTDSISNSDSITSVREFIRSVSDTILNSDTLTRLLSISLADSLSISDSLSKRIKLALADTLSNSDSISVLREYVRTLADTISISDSITATRDFFRSLADTLSTSSTLTSKHKLSLADSQSSTDSILLKIKRPISQSLSITDTLQRLSNFVRNASDSLSNSDLLIIKVIRPLTDESTVSDALTSKRSSIRSLADIVSISESLISKVKRSLADSISNSDTISILKQFARSVSDTITISSTLFKKLKTSITDTIGAIEDSIDIEVQVGVFSRFVSDTITVSDSLLRKIKLSLTDAITNNDSISKLRRVERELEDTIENSDTLEYLKIISRSLSDTLAVTDSLLRKIKISLQSNISIQDLLVKPIHYFFSVADTVSISDTINFIRVTVGRAVRRGRRLINLSEFFGSRE